MTDPRHESHPGGQGRLDPRKLLREAVAVGDAAKASSAWEPPDVTSLAARFPELDAIELIGRGGMGAVYRAVQRKLGRTVALKVLPPELAADPAFEERFLREARALASLKHPRIVTLHDFGERDGLYYLVTEFVDGVDLRRLMGMGELSPADALRLAPQICEALQYAHDHGVVHRDVKPENLLVDTAGEVKIADFGLARVLGDAPGAPTLTRSSQVMGTPHYMAPEQWRQGQAVDHRADIYAVGVVLYEMLTGQLPLGHFEPPSQRPGVPRGLDRVVQRALAQRPEQRYQRAGDVGDDLRREARAVPAGVSGRRRPRRDLPGPWSALRTAWILLVLAIALSFAVMQSRQREGAVTAASQAEDARQRAALAENDAPLGGIQAFAPPSDGLSMAIAWRIGVPLLLFFGFVFSFFGFVAIARIRRRRSGTSGLGLALLTAWGMPLALWVTIPPLVLAENLRDPDTAVLASTMLALVLFATAVWWLVRCHRRVAAEAAQPAA